MRKALMIAHLMAMRAAIDVLVLELSGGGAESTGVACCAAPDIRTEQTYSGAQTYCANCGWSSKAGPEEVRGEQSQSDKVRGG